MIFNSHSELATRHAFLSPSNYHWLGYDEQRLEARFHTFRSAKRGTDIHAFAHEAIRLNLKLDTRSNKALATYVNDGIGYKMVCEQPLYYSDNCFGTPDTMIFRRNKLRIHDLKTGTTPSKMRQLEVYAALFCLEYGYSPYEIEIELRIYQGENVEIEIPDPDTIALIMEKIIDADQQVEILKEARW